MAEMAAALADYIRADKLERDGGSSDSHSSVLGQSHAGTARADVRLVREFPVGAAEQLDRARIEPADAAPIGA